MYARARLSIAAIVAVISMLFATNAMADDGKGAFDYIPKDTMMVMSVDIEQLAKTDVFKDFMSALMSDKEAKDNLEKLKKATGFDPEKDLDSLVIAMPPDVEKTENVLVVGKAKIDSKKMMEFAKTEGAAIKEAKHEGATYYEIDNEGAIYFDGSYMVAGPIDAVKAGIETKNGKMKNLGSNKAVSSLVKSVNTKADFWMAVNIPKSIQKQLAKENPMMGDIVNAHASFDLGKGLGVRVTLGASNDNTAKSLVDLANATIQGAGSDAQLKAMGLDSAIKNLKITANGKDINVKLDLTQDEFDKIKQMLKALSGM